MFTFPGKITQLLNSKSVSQNLTHVFFLPVLSVWASEAAELGWRSRQGHCAFGLLLQVLQALAAVSSVQSCRALTGGRLRPGHHPRVGPPGAPCSQGFSPAFHMASRKKGRDGE